MRQHRPPDKPSLEAIYGSDNSVKNLTLSVSLQFAASLLLSAAILPAHGQQTIFNVPSADIMDAGKTYFEWDATVGDTSPSASLTSRMVRGIGRNMEAGINVPSVSAPTASMLAIVPTLKWKLYDTRSHDFTLIAGNEVFVPVMRRTYTLGDSFYVEGAKSFHSGTRVSTGVYDFTAGVMDHANRAGLMAAVEQTINARMGVAADWYSGNNTMGYVTPGLNYKLSNSVTALAGYQLGNHDLTQGNHSLLLILGWIPTWSHARK